MAAEAGDINCPPNAGKTGDTARREFFFGSAGAGPGFHHDGVVETFLCQLIGSKQVNVFSPADIPYLYPAASWLAPTGHFSAVADPFNADTGKFPLFGRASAFVCQPDPGDVLYVPPHWYHDTAPRGPTVSMTIRHTPPAEACGTLQDRDALKAVAGELYARLLVLAPAARIAYSTLIGRDLAGDEGCLLKEAGVRQEACEDSNA